MQEREANLRLLFFRESVAKTLPVKIGVDYAQLSYLGYADSTHHHIAYGVNSVLVIIIR